MLQWLPWQDGVAASGVAAVATAVLARRSSAPARAVRTWTRELAVMFALYGLWQYAGQLSVTQQTGAVARGRAIWRAERRLGLPSEASLQHLLLGHRGLLRLANIYYAQVHVAALGVCLVWLFARHRDRYPPVRNVLVLVTGACLLIQLLPVAPPRLVPGIGVVDTGHLVGPSVYAATVSPGLDQLSSMPSLHVGWAVVVAGAAISVGRSRWRLAWVAYPALTLFVVVVTGNHYWADGIVAVGICALSLAAVRAVSATRRPRPPGAAAVPAGAPAGAGPGRRREAAPSLAGTHGRSPHGHGG